ncbi:sodium:solute symporter family protein [Kushneria aurantia]|uniref:Sodium:solute symporter n=1 Tax=Kushneria aurantia TaxID=504092 RepID=A0ABV6G2K6_9GAMM|nr:sodium:solute symporter family protein [Kushneria aurantia]
MNSSLVTIITLAVFILIFCALSLLAGRKNKASADDYVVAGRRMNTPLLLMSMGATYFSTWTLLGSFGVYYREGIWFAGFTTWAIIQGSVFIWLFGTRLWYIGKKFGFITPGQMVEHYYASPTLRLLFSCVGIVALVPVMLIQVTGSATALASLTDNAIPYTVGVIVSSVVVGFIVLWSGFRGTAWADAFMGVFFATILVFTAIFVVGKAGGLSFLNNVADHKPQLLTNKGNPMAMLELWLGLSFGAWALPHMWQKFYSASSAEVLGKVAMFAPFWNSWMMACVPLAIGLSANIPGLIPGAADNSDAILPLIFSEYAPILGSFVVAGILAAAISTINSQLLSSSSLVAEDIWRRFFNKNMGDRSLRLVNRIVVLVITTIVLVLALAPSGAGYLIPIASLGFSLGLQLVPTALGMLYIPVITPKGALAGLASGVVILAATAATGFDYFFGPGINGIIVNILFTTVVSLVTMPAPRNSENDYHKIFASAFGQNNIEEGKNSVYS